MLEDSSLSEIEIVEGEESVRLSRGPIGPVTGAPAPMQYPIPADVQAAAWSAPAMPAEPAAPAMPADPQEETVPEGELVRAPMGPPREATFEGEMRLWYVDVLKLSPLPEPKPHDHPTTSTAAAKLDWKLEPADRGKWFDVGA